MFLLYHSTKKVCQKTSESIKKVSGVSFIQAGTTYDGAVPECGTGCENKMSIHKELKKRGFVFDRKYGCNENQAEIWINKETEMGVRIEWFRLD